MADAATAPTAALSEFPNVSMYGEKAGTPKSLVRIPASFLLNLLTAAAQGFQRYETIAARDADESQLAGVLGYVYANNGSAADAANGWYQWSGSEWATAAWISNDLVAAVQPLVDQAETAQLGAVAAAAGVESARSDAVAAAGTASAAAELVGAAIDDLADELAAGQPVTDYSVQRLFGIRGLILRPGAHVTRLSRGAAPAGTALVANQLYVRRVFVDAGGAVDKLRVQVSAAVAASALHVCLYKAASFDPQETLLERLSGTGDETGPYSIATTATGVRESATGLGMILEDNSWYWLAVGTTVAGLSVLCLTEGEESISGSLNIDGNAAAYTFTGFTGVFPSTLTIGLSATTRFPALGLITAA